MGDWHGCHVCQGDRRRMPLGCWDARCHCLRGGIAESRAAKCTRLEVINCPSVSVARTLRSQSHSSQASNAACIRECLAHFPDSPVGSGSALGSELSLRRERDIQSSMVYKYIPSEENKGLAFGCRDCRLVLPSKTPRPWQGLRSLSLCTFQLPSWPITAVACGDAGSHGH